MVVVANLCFFFHFTADFLHDRLQLRDNQSIFKPPLSQDKAKNKKKKKCMLVAAIWNISKEKEEIKECLIWAWYYGLRMSIYSTKQIATNSNFQNITLKKYMASSNDGYMEKRTSNSNTNKACSDDWIDIWHGVVSRKFHKLQKVLNINLVTM